MATIKDESNAPQQSASEAEEKTAGAIGRRLAAVRKTRQRSQPEFAERLGISVSSYRNYERGTTTMPLMVAMDACEMLGLSVEWLLFGRGGRDTPNMRRRLEEAVMEVKAFIGAHSGQMLITQRTEVRLVRVLFEYMVEHERISISFRDMMLREVATAAKHINDLINRQASTGP